MGYYARRFAKPVGRADANHAELVRHLKALGISVADLSRVGGGVPDLLVASRRAGTFLIEVKRPAEARTEKDGYTRVGKAGALLQSQLDFAADWQGRIVVATCIEDIAAALGAAREGM